MSTLAFKDGMFAADTASASDGSVIFDDETKIRKRRDGQLAGAVGFAGFCARHLRWFESGELGPAPEATEDDLGVIIRPNGLLHIFDAHGWYPARPTRGYWAAGSGELGALCAMACGATAAEAVRACTIHDANSGGDITVLRLGA